MARRGVVVLISLAVISLAVCAVGEDADGAAAGLVNTYRATLALPGLAVDAGRDKDAPRWVEHNADGRALSPDALKLNRRTVMGAGAYTHLGVAVAARGALVYVVQRFGTRIPVPPTVPPTTLAPASTTTVTLAPPVLCRQVPR